MTDQSTVPLPTNSFRTLIFWLFAEKESLHPRLDRRVDKMIEVSLPRRQSHFLPHSKLTAFFARCQRGLLDEIDELWQIANRPGAEPTNYSKGIYQSIGMHSFCIAVSRLL